MSRSATGTVTTIVSPPPGVSSGTTVAPTARANPCATARPSPTPLPLASPSRWKGSNIRARALSGRPGPRSTTRSSTPSRVADAPTRTSPGENRTALATTFATTRSSRPASVRTSGRSSGRTRSTCPAPDGSTTESTAGQTTSSSETARSDGTTPPVCRRDRSSRLSMSCSSRPVAVATVSTSASSSAGARTTPGARKPSTAVRIAASGVRRSCETAARSAVRVASASARTAARDACSRRRRYSRTMPAWAAKASSTCRSPAGRGRPSRTRRRTSSIRTGVRVSSPGPPRAVVPRRPAAGSVPAVGARRASAITDHGASGRSAVRSSSTARRTANVSASRETSASAVSSPASTERDRAASVDASARARAAWTDRRAPRSTTEATATATSTKSSRASRFSGSATVSSPVGGVKNQLMPRNETTAHARAGHIPPTSATPTVRARNTRTCVGRPTSSSTPSKSRVSSAGAVGASTQPAARRRTDSGLIARRETRPARARSWVTRWTSSAPERRAISALVDPSSASRHRECRDTPTTTMVALTPRAKSTTAVGTSSPTTVWKVPPSDSTSSRSAASAAGGAAGRPSVARTCTASSSEPAARSAMRAPRRRSVALSGPPVTATTTRSRAGQVPEIACSVRYRVRASSTRSASHSSASSRSAVRLPSRKYDDSEASICSARYTLPCARRRRSAWGERSTSWIWSASRTTWSGTVSRWRTPVIASTSSVSDSRCCTLTVVTTSIPSSSRSCTSCHRLGWREPGAFVCASSSTSTTSGRRARTASTSSSVSATPRWPTTRRGTTSRSSIFAAVAARPCVSTRPTTTSVPRERRRSASSSIA
ncbi:hypothetical protein BJF88_11640 [Cellulosimicrobium sp. CUA-896]|nr:hypothetical protein BJF88_11640 [Cellulosimicrobium sp. CUA-896]